MSYSPPAPPFTAQWPSAAPPYKGAVATVSAAFGTAPLLAFLGAAPVKFGALRVVPEQFITPAGAATSAYGAFKTALDGQYLAPWGSWDAHWQVSAVPYLGAQPHIVGSFAQSTQYLAFVGRKPSVPSVPLFAKAQTFAPSGAAGTAHGSGFLLLDWQYAPKYNPINGVFSSEALGYSGAQAEQDGAWFIPQAGEAQTLSFLSNTAPLNAGTATFALLDKWLVFNSLSASTYGKPLMQQASVLRFSGAAPTQYGAAQFTQGQGAAQHLSFSSAAGSAQSGAFTVLQASLAAQSFSLASAAGSVYGQALIAQGAGAAQSLNVVSAAATFASGTPSFVMGAAQGQTLSFASASNTQSGQPNITQGAAPDALLVFVGVALTQCGKPSILGSSDDAQMLSFSSANTTQYGQGKVFASFQMASAPSTFQSGTAQINRDFKMFMSPSHVFCGITHFALADEHEDVDGSWAGGGSGSGSGSGAGALGFISAKATHYGKLHLRRDKRHFTLLQNCQGGTTRYGRPRMVQG